MPLLKNVGSTNLDVKKTNRNLILKYIFSKENTSRQDIASSLHMSMPTVLVNINELQEVGIVTDNGRYESTGGRKAAVICSVPDYRYGVGVDITRKHIKVVIVNLVGETKIEKRVSKPYEDSIDYYQFLQNLVWETVRELGIKESSVLGIGISFPGFISEDGQKVTDSYALKVKNVDCSRIAGELPWSSTLINDASAAGLAELALSDFDRTMAYLSLSDSVGGAVIIHGNLYSGMTGKGGEFGHMRIVPDGKQCYCGQKGCLDAYCSTLQFYRFSEEGHIKAFFERMWSGDKECVELWKDYKRYLSIAIINLRMNFDCDIVLGGYMGEWLEPYLNEIKDEVRTLNPFESDCSYVSICRLKKYTSAIGAALEPIHFYMDRF